MTVAPHESVGETDPMAGIQRIDAVTLTTADMAASAATTATTIATTSDPAMVPRRCR